MLFLWEWVSDSTTEQLVVTNMCSGLNGSYRLKLYMSFDGCETNVLQTNLLGWNTVLYNLLYVF